MKRLPLPISLALSLYYLNRARQWDVKQHYTPDMPPLTVTRTPFMWDKAADLAAIIAACRGGWSFTACAGTFWFTKAKENGVAYRVDEESFPSVKRQVNKGA